MLGWRLPDFILNRVIKRRRLSLEQGMPDALDLLVICAEAGLSLNQAIEEISKQLRMSNKDVADEFAATSAEMQILSDFGEALDNLVERTGLDDLRSLTATLKQSLKFGTPLAESLRMIAGEMRAARLARIEERAARLPVLLAIPMMMFILPCLLMIVGTPVVLRMVDVFSTVSFPVR
jgi:tight adherence protein C